MRNSRWGIALLVALVGTVYFLDAVLMPFIAGLILAYLADPLTNYFQRLGMKRVWAVSSVFLVLMIVLALSLLILIPLVVQQIKQLGEALPGVLNWIEGVLAPQVQEWTGYDLASELSNVRETLVENWRGPGVRPDWPLGYGVCLLGHLCSADSCGDVLFAAGLGAHA